MEHKFYFELEEWGDWDLHVEPELTGNEEDKWSLVEEKWATVVAFLREHPELGFDHIYLGGTTTCAFCASYHFAGSKCSPKCPIKKVTGTDFCADTPYVLFEEGTYGGKTPRDVTPLEAALEELEFLRTTRGKVEGGHLAQWLEGGSAVPGLVASLDVPSGLGIGGIGSEDYNLATEAEPAVPYQHGAAPAGAPVAPAGTTQGQSNPQGRCAFCGCPGDWNPGAGRDLCARHWDAY